MVSLGVLNNGSASKATAISSDGEVIVGSATDGLLGDQEYAVRWTSTNPIASLGPLNGGNYSAAFAVSANGSVIVGRATDASAGGKLRAFRWTLADGMQSLDTLNNGATSAAFAVSGDGSVVAGEAIDGSDKDEMRAFRWTSSDPILRSLGVLDGGNHASARGISSNGQVIVGEAADGSDGNALRGFRWTAASGMQSVEQWLRAAGVSVAPTLKTRIATATNANGSVVVGQLDNDHAYIARVSPRAGGTGTESDGASTAGTGSGLIDTTAFLQTLQATARTQHLAIHEADIVMHGLHGSPMRGLLKKGQHSTWVGGDLGRQDHHDNHGNIDAGEAGYAYGVTGDLMLKAAVGRTYSDNRLIDDGDMTLRGAYLLPEIIYAIPDSPLRASASAYYNAGEARFRHGYLNAGTQDYSRGKAATVTTALRLRLDWLNAGTIAGTMLSPYASLTRYHNRLDAYSESGGGFPVRWNARSEINTQARLGTDAIHDLGNGMNLIGRLEAVRRLETTGSGATGEIIDLGNFSFAGEAGQRHWLRAAVGAEGKAGPGILSLMLNATTRGQTPSAWVFAHYRIHF